MGLVERFVRNNDAPFEEIDGEVLVVSPDNRNVHRLNPTTSFLWNRLDRPRSGKDLVGRLVRDFDVSPDVAGRDVAAFLLRLTKKDLIRTAP